MQTRNICSGRVGILQCDIICVVSAVSTTRRTHRGRERHSGLRLGSTVGHDGVESGRRGSEDHALYVGNILHIFLQRGIRAVVAERQSSLRGHRRLQGNRPSCFGTRSHVAPSGLRGQMCGGIRRNSRHRPAVRLRVDGDCRCREQPGREQGSEKFLHSSVIMVCYYGLEQSESSPPA